MFSGGGRNVRNQMLLLPPDIVEAERFLAAAAANLDDETLRELRQRSAESLKRVHHESVTTAGWTKHDSQCSPWKVEPFVEMKTMWHPSAC